MELGEVKSSGFPQVLRKEGRSFLGGEGTADRKLTRIGNEVAARTLGSKKPGKQAWKPRAGPEKQSLGQQGRPCWRACGPGGEPAEDPSSSGRASLEEGIPHLPGALLPG